MRNTSKLLLEIQLKKKLKLQEQSSRLEISELCAELQNAQKEARWERKAMQQHAKRQQARLLLEEKCAHFKSAKKRRGLQG